MKLFDYIGVLFGTDQQWDDLTGYDKSKNSFMTNRFMAIKFPIQADLFNGLKTDPVGQAESWRLVARKFSRVPSFIYTKVSKKGKKQKKHQGRPAAEGQVPQSFAGVERGYSYDATGKRDPFRDFKWDRPDRMHAREIDGPLQQFDLGQLSLVAVVWKTGNARALVQDPSGENYIVAEGSRIGKNSGHVIAIHDSAMVVKETYMDFLGQETTKDIEMRLRRNEGG